MGINKMRFKLFLILGMSACQLPVGNDHPSMNDVRTQALRVCEEYRQTGITTPMDFPVYKHQCHWRPMLAPETMCVCSPFEDAQ